MRVRLMVSFLLVIVLSLLGVSILVRQSAQNEIQTFLGRGGLIGAEALVEELETWYATNGSWDGVETVMPGSDHAASRGNAGSGAGAGGPQQGMGRLNTLRLADADGVIIYEPLNQENVGTIMDQDANKIELSFDGEVIGFLQPQEDGYAQENAQFEARFLERINNASLAAAAISGGVALVLALLLAYVLIKPVNVLVGATEAVAKGDFTYRVAIKKPKELARLGKTFNQMASALEQAEKRRKNLSSDIAHELRTPLAVQRAHLEAMADGVFPMTKENMQTIQAQNNLLNRLVEDLRLITLADSGKLALDIQNVDMHRLVTGIIEQFTAKAKEKNITIKKDLQACGNIRADAQRIQQILHNLLQNSIRYTPENGTLFVNLLCTDDSMRCIVRDTGSGIPEEALPFIFDRFYRVERSRSKNAGGTGLGLAIARNLAEIHHGSLRAANHPNGGAEFVLTLPINQPSA